ncbi:MAG: DMT family transporter [Arenicellales bacterium]|jgi:drug/metabolite transporter (DMT)-like permease|nr:EamA family transporter [Acidiferrobacteraceae bacterium]MDP6139631.1 DMT family transporter [Arenicellales bacterium]HCV21409.1 EamA family transporter [Gammaproteobacteria bacterium]MDP6313345.1 DMT family transporter [Arenicellales bacterium]MDP7119798.1 DMT family transporter [Arenicellales bacterium]|tara:strand:- start:2651 stop:3496 length:846 start_codon:yes stop_codon:yes gene_type:complete
MLLETTALVLLAALLHAAWNALVKTAASPLLTLASLNLVAAAAGTVLVWFMPLPAAAALPYLAGSVTLHWGYYAFLVSAYRVGDLSHVYPLSRGIAPLLVAGGGALTAGEYLPLLTLAGIVVASAGIMLLAVPGRSLARPAHRPTALALGTGCWIAAYTLVDGLGARQSGSPLSYIGWLFVLEGLTFSLFVLARQPLQMLQLWRANSMRLSAGGLATASAYGIVIFVMYYSPMAVVAALRETSVIMAALIGTWYLGEGSGRLRLVAAALVSGGIVIMSLPA